MPSRELFVIVYSLEHAEGTLVLVATGKLEGLLQIKCYM
jgi:hypothetical protein